MRKLERALLDLADRWEDEARQHWEEMMDFTPRPIPPHCCSKEHEHHEELRRIRSIQISERHGKLSRCARELRGLISTIPTESIQELLANYAGKDS